jgi:hypothetical protein
LFIRCYILTRLLSLHVSITPKNRNISHFKDFQNFSWSRVDDSSEEVCMKYRAYCTRGEEHTISDFAPVDPDLLTMRPQRAQRPWEAGCSEATKVMSHIERTILPSLAKQSVPLAKRKACKAEWDTFMETLKAPVSSMPYEDHAKMLEPSQDGPPSDEEKEEGALGTVHTVEELAFDSEPVVEIVHEGNRRSQVRLNREATASVAEDAQLQAQSRTKVFDQIEVGEVVAVRLVPAESGLWKLAWGLAVVLECIGASTDMASTLRVAWLVEMDPKAWGPADVVKAVNDINWTFIPGDKNRSHSERVDLRSIFPLIRQQPILLQPDEIKIPRASVSLILGEAPLTQQRKLNKQCREKLIKEGGGAI